MSSDSSFPRPPDRRAHATRPEEGARVLEFPADEVGAPVEPSTGAWAAEEAEAARSTERLARRGNGDAQVVAFPRQPVTQTRRRSQPPAREATPDASGAQPTQAPLPPSPEPASGEEPLEQVVRPAYLASELLKQDWFPRTPLARTLRYGALGIGVAGAIALFALGGGNLGAWILAGVLGACAIAGGLPFAAQSRGPMLAALGLAGTAAASWLRMEQGHEPAAPLLAACTTLTASAFFFRAAHRTSRLARVLVALGLGATAAWLVLTGGLDALVIESLAWQGWVFPVLRLLLAFALVSSLLTFLDPTGHGGAWVAGAAFLGWLAFDTIATVALAAWPLEGPGTLSTTDPAWLATFAFPFLAAIAAGGLCQLWVLTSRPAAKREAPPSRATLA